MDSNLFRDLCRNAGHNEHCLRSGKREGKQNPKEEHGKEEKEMSRKLINLKTGITVIVLSFGLL